MHALAIVIPAYKPEFFRAALASVAAQTDARFRVYVGDDAAPAEIGRIAGEVAATLSASGIELVYRRFDENLGRRSLTAHWNRCVALASEPWVWLFSDDDVMAPDCVAAFHEALSLGEAPSVVRFDTDVIDAAGRTLAVNPPHPREESGIDFVYARLNGQRNSYVVEYVFRREAFERAGGFPDYPVAWCADDAAWYAFSGGGVIRTLPRGRVRWRASGINITDAKRKNQREKLEAGTRFLRFVRDEVEPADASGTRSSEDWRRARERWWIDQVRYLMPVGPSLWPAVLRSADGVWRRTGADRLRTLAAWNAIASLRWMRGLLRNLLQHR
ncbi:MAG: glycosyltransferase family A protein [Gemmatimonadales bacterium]